MARPANWHGLSLNERLTLLEQLRDSHRGNLIIGQSLIIAADVLRERGELSNAEDAEDLAHLFPIGKMAEEINQETPIKNRRPFSKDDFAHIQRTKREAR